MRKGIIAFLKMFIFLWVWALAEREFIRFMAPPFWMVFLWAVLFIGSGIVVVCWILVKYLGPEEEDDNNG